MPLIAAQGGVHNKLHKMYKGFLLVMDQMSSLGGGGRRPEEENPLYLVKPEVFPPPAFSHLPREDTRFSRILCNLLYTQTKPEAPLREKVVNFRGNRTKNKTSQHAQKCAAPLPFGIMDRFGFLRKTAKPAASTLPEGGHGDRFGHHHQAWIIPDSGRR